MQATVLRHTGAAVLVRFKDEDIWLPRSQLSDECIDELPSEGEAEIIMTAWIAKQKGLR